MAGLGALARAVASRREDGAAAPLACARRVVAASGQAPVREAARRG